MADVPHIQTHLAGGPADRCQHRTWQELALWQGTESLRTDTLPRLFDDDEDLALFLAAAHGETTV